MSHLPLSWLLHLLVSSLLLSFSLCVYHGAYDEFHKCVDCRLAATDADGVSLIHVHIYDILYDTIRCDTMRCDNYMSISISGVHFDIELLFHGSCCVVVVFVAFVVVIILVNTFFTNFVVSLVCPPTLSLTLWL